MMKLTLSLIVGCLLTAGALQASPDPARYFDIPKGTTFTFDVSGTVSMQMLIVITDNTLRGSQRVVTMSQQVSFAGKGGDPLASPVSQRGKVLAKLDQVYRLTKDRVVQVTGTQKGKARKQVVVKGPLAPGKGWKDNAEVTAKYTVVETDAKITTPAGPFSDVLVIRQVIELQGKKQTTLSYYAPGLGLVKSTTKGLNNVDVILKRVTTPAKR